MKAFVPKYFLIGLCAYLWKIELSIDRSLGDLEEFRRYCKSPEFVSLEQVLIAIKRLIPETRAPALNLSHSYSKPSICNRILEWVFKRGASIEIADLQHISLLLEFLKDKLQRNISLDRAEFVSIRLAMAYAAAFLSERIFFASRRARTENVTHLNQNLILTRESLQEICDGNAWP